MFQKKTFMNIKMIAVDIGDTLWHDDDSISDRKIETLKKAREKNRRKIFN